MLALAWLLSSAIGAASPDVDGAARLLADGDYEGAADAAQALVAAGGLRHEQLVEVMRIDATARAFSGDVDGAAAAFVTLLTFAPDFTIPYTASPKVTRAFELARNEKKPAIRIDVAKDAVNDEGGCGVDVVRAVDVDQRVARLQVIAVREGETATRALPAPPVGAAARVALPESHCAPGVVHVNVVAEDAVGSALVIGAPVDVDVAAADDGTLLPAVLTVAVVVSAVVAGAVAVALFANSAPPDEVPLRLEVVR